MFRQGAGIERVGSPWEGNSNSSPPWKVHGVVFGAKPVRCEEEFLVSGLRLNASKFTGLGFHQGTPLARPKKHPHP